MSNEEHVTATETEELRRLFHRAMKTLTPNNLRPSSPCPDSETMVSYVTGVAPQHVQKRINAHLAFCDACWDDYVALVGADKIAELVRSESTEEKASLPVAIRDAKEKWSQLVARAKDTVIDLGRTYGPGAFIGAVKILAEGPAPVVRGAAPSYMSYKVIEVPIDENVYGIEILEKDNDFVFDVAGYKMTKPTVMRLAVQLQSGDELADTETDNYGYASLTLPKERLPEGEFALTFALGNDLWEMLFLRLPEKGSV